MTFVFAETSRVSMESAAVGADSDNLFAVIRLAISVTLAPSGAPRAKFRSVFSYSAVALLCAVLFGPSDVLSQEPPTQALSRPPGPTVNLAYMDRTVRPGDDFYQFACGEWIKHAPIPADSAGVSIGSVLLDETNKRVAELIVEATKNTVASGNNSRKIADLYTSYMDEAGIEAKGLASLTPHLFAIAKIGDKHELARALGESLRADVDGLNKTNFHTANLFGLWVKLFCR
jgi:hypothetical protein